MPQAATWIKPSHLFTRWWADAMGVRVSKPSCRSKVRLQRLSTMLTAYPRADRWSAVAHPQYPSPPASKCRLFRWHASSVSLHNGVADTRLSLAKGVCIAVSLSCAQISRIWSSTRWRSHTESCFRAVAPLHHQEPKSRIPCC